MDKLQLSDAPVAAGVFQAAQLFKTSMNLQQHAMTTYAQKRVALTTELTEYVAKALALDYRFLYMVSERDAPSSSPSPPPPPLPRSPGSGGQRGGTK